jgi:hypothetical protein
MHYPPMHGTLPSVTPTSVKSRQISEADLPEVTDLLTRGYEHKRPRMFWEGVFAGLTRRSVPTGYPRFGYVIESDGNLVGVLLTIFSTIWKDGVASIRCNGSSFYVDPNFRVYASLLSSQAFRDKNVTALNITAAPHTRKMVEASGFTKYSDGYFAAVPVLSRTPKHVSVRVIDARDEPGVAYNSHDRELLLEHADFGCTGLWCVADGQAYPFVFRARSVKRLPSALLIYCSSLEDFLRFARPIGLYLARRLQLLVILDANGPIPGLYGKYRANMPRYFRGPDRPRLGDLAYTEAALFDV